MWGAAPYIMCNLWDTAVLCNYLSFIEGSIVGNMSRWGQCRERELFHYLVGKPFFNNQVYCRSEITVIGLYFHAS